MKESYRKRTSDPTWPRAMRGQAVRLHLKRWTGVYVGGVLSSEICESGSRRCPLCRKAKTRCAIARAQRGPAESKTPRTHRNSGCENRETQSLSAAKEQRTGGRKR